MKREEELNTLSHAIIGAAMEVHNALGPGLLESAYEACLAYELLERGFKAEQQKPLPLVYKGIELDCGYRMDLLVNDTIIVELKSIDKFEPIHTAQLLSYLKLADLELGLLLNFNVLVLKQGIRRVVNRFGRNA